MGTLYLVGTPIGNLEDITVRALRVLAEVRLIAAEDTRQARKLLGRYGIQTPLVSFHAHSGRERVQQLLTALGEGDIAVVSDAGMPGISDPGAELVRAAAEAGYPVVVVPGPSAVTAAVAVSGLVTDGFVFTGFLPRRSSERRERLSLLRDLPYPLVVFEAPHRLRETLHDAVEVLGDRPVAVCRELTKRFEEVRRTTLAEAAAHYAQHEPRGEFVLVIAAGSREHPQADEQRLEELVRERLTKGLSAAAVARELARLTGRPRRELYRLAVTVQQEEQKNEADGKGGTHATGAGT